MALSCRMLHLNSKEFKYIYFSFNFSVDKNISCLGISNFDPSLRFTNSVRKARVSLLLHHFIRRKVFSKYFLAVNENTYTVSP